MSDALQRLIEAVEAGTLTGDDPTCYADGMIDLIEGAGVCRASDWDDVALAHDGSLDAAKALHEALLPGWHRELCDYFVRLRCGPKMGFADVRDGNLGRAWLLAILRAYQQVQQ